MVAFGDPEVAEVATLGINPSGAEFLDDRDRMLSGAARRLATLESLGATSTDSLTEDQVTAVARECAAYFHRNPYRRWFDPLDEIVQRGLDVSYYQDTACHLDIVQWATSPIWGHIDDPTAKQRLLEEGAPHLRRQLETENVRLVIVNGAQVWDQLAATGLATFDDVARITYGNRQAPATLRAGEGCGVRFLGWTLNVQSSQGVRREDRQALGDWLRSMTEPIPEPPAAPPASDTGYLDRRTVHSKAEFTDVLRAWAENSTQGTAGDVGSYGGTWVLRLTTPDGQTASLNADTKRAAVLAYLDLATADGPDRPWRLLANRSGTFNKLDFAPDGPPIPGWYCYLTPAGSRPQAW